MGFFDTLRRVLHIDNHPARDVAHAWGLDEESTGEGVVASEVGLYDRAQWQKKLKRVLEGLPATKPEWADLAADARALNMDAAWVKKVELDEFMLLVRRAISDRHFTEDEHRKLDVARDLMGLSEEKAEEVLHGVIAEAEKFFGKKVDGA